MDTARPRVITAGRIITPSGDLTPGSVEIDGGRIVSVRAGAAPGADLSAADGVLAPGFIDLQINGAAGGGFFFCPSDVGLARVRPALAAAAVTAALGTTVA